MPSLRGSVECDILDHRMLTPITAEIPMASLPDTGAWRLWAAVLEDAVRCAVAPVSKADRRDRQHAIDWLRSDARHAQSAHWVCDHVGVSLAAIREKVREVEAGLRGLTAKKRLGTQRFHVNGRPPASHPERVRPRNVGSA